MNAGNKQNFKYSAVKRKTNMATLLTHIHAAYHQLQASLTTLAQRTRNQEHKANIGIAQQDLDHWRIAHWSKINPADRKKQRGKAQDFFRVGGTCADRDVSTPG